MGGCPGVEQESGVVQTRWETSQVSSVIQVPKEAPSTQEAIEEQVAPEAQAGRWT